MATDIATLGIKVDASTVDQAAEKLDKLTASGSRAEGQIKETGGATDVMANRMAKLKASIDPAGFAIDKVNAELAEAKMLFESGALSANDYAQAQNVLNARAEAFAARQQVNNARLIQGAGAARLTAAETLNLSRQFADIGVTAAMGMNPLMILIQQGPQIADIMKTSGLSIKDVFVEFGRMLGIVRVVTAANDNQAVSATAASVANSELAASATAAATAQGRLGAASASAASGVAAGAVAAEAATAANGAMGVSATAAGAATTVAFTPLAIILGAVLVAVGALTAGFAVMANEVEKNVGDVGKSMKLTEDQLDHLKDKGVSTSVTMGDAFFGFFDTIGQAIREQFGPEIQWLQDKFDAAWDWITGGVKSAFKFMLGVTVGTIYAMRVVVDELPAAFKDAGAAAANYFLEGIEFLVNKTIEGLNKITATMNMFLGTNIKAVDGFGGFEKFGRTGAASKFGANVSGAFNEGFGKASGMFEANVANRTKGRINEGLEDYDAPNGRSKKGGQSEFEKRTKEAEDFIKNLKEETEEIGKNAIEVKRMAAERAAAKAPTAALSKEILDAQKAWETSTANEAVRKLKEELTDQAEALKFETSVMGMNNEARAIATAQREIDLKLRELERDGISISAEQIEKETKAILDNAAARGKLKDEAEEASKVADIMRDVHDSVREAVDAFGELFGRAGEGFASLINVITDYKDRQLEAEAEIAAAREKYGSESMKFKEEEGRVAAEMARAEMDYYGDMISSAKRFFKEKSAGYKALEAIERAYRAYQAISMIIEAANVMKSIMLDGTKTASSVANSGARATADGVAAIAKAIASLPFPLNLVAGAATAAALVAFGVKVFGGGGGKGAASVAESEAKKPTYNGPVDEYGAPTSSYSVLRPGATRVGEAANNNSIAPGLVGRSGSGNSVTVSPSYSITIEGNANEETVRQLRAVAQEITENAVQLSKQAVAEDMSEQQYRQRIGGA